MKNLTKPAIYAGVLLHRECSVSENKHCEIGVNVRFHMVVVPLPSPTGGLILCKPKRNTSRLTLNNTILSNGSSIGKLKEKNNNNNNIRVIVD